MLEITEIPVDGYERVCRAVDSASGFHAIIAVHSTVLGPALGGMRLWPYASEDEALFDVKRLSRGMTYKASCAGLDLGGGKSVFDRRSEGQVDQVVRAHGRVRGGLCWLLHHRSGCQHEAGRHGGRSYQNRTCLWIGRQIG